MITTLAGIATAVVATLVSLVMRRRAHQAEASPVLVRYGLDPQGRVWSVRRLDGRSVRLYRDGRVHVDACGPLTLRTLTRRYGISWER